LNKPIPDDLIPIGVFTKPHGIKGELKVKLYNPHSSSLFPEQEIWLKEDGCWKNSAITVFRGEGIQSRVKIDSSSTRNDAEKLRGVEIYIQRIKFPQLAEEDFYLVDLIGFTAIDDKGKIIGEIIDIMENPANDIFIIKDGDIEHLIPNVDEFVQLFDFENKRVTFNVIEGLLNNQ
jgi:16S rRNA processing protein RimM